MSKEVLWTQEVIDEFIRLGNLSELELKVLKTRVFNHWKIPYQAYKFSVSQSTIDRTIFNLKIKYDACQKRSAILPERDKKSAKL